MLLSLEVYRSSDVHYEDVNIPVIVYHGDKDTEVPSSCATWMRDNMPRCEVLIKPGATHSILLDMGFMTDVVLPGLCTD